MNPKTILFLLATATLSTASPAPQQQTPAVLTPAEQSAQLASSIALAASAAALEIAKNSVCADASYPSKQCCQTVNSVTEGVTKPLDQLFALIDGTTTTSAMSLDWKIRSRRLCVSYEKAMKDNLTVRYG
ncbi:hypothetical protein BDV26DRAFT_290067 [Aspergillus bertholletiae]|uniref:Hydrophobin n=1 Tax=Aspergillus bertholletiae TaxID=1226010 RepID=A0A5N7BG88_9EURO|nr:hypothetical protein BDV26DRAFT_290067 [Aspergillus bertholletiae]